MIESIQVAVMNGDVPLHTGDVFRFAYNHDYPGEGLKRLENPPIVKDEMGCNIFVEAINWYDQWIDGLHPGHSAILHLIGDDASAIVASRNLLRTSDNQVVSVFVDLGA